MDSYIALFRGINVGGKNCIPMKDLKGIIETCGYQGAETYIQSGNVLFLSTASKAKQFSKEVGTAIEKRFGFLPEIFLLTSKQLEDAIRANPFPDVEPKSLHFYFLAEKPEKFDVSAVIAPTEECKLVGKVFYLYAPEGIGRSKLALRLEKLLGVSATGRNGKTVHTLFYRLQGQGG